MLFNEPKLLKSPSALDKRELVCCFSALQRAEIAEISASRVGRVDARGRFSALQRAEIAEIKPKTCIGLPNFGFSALQRAEIAEIDCVTSLPH